MEAEARYTWVGAAVIALLAAMVAALVWLKNSGDETGFRHYTIHFERQALDGLDIGADVTLRGIKVGRVEDYALADDKLNRVRVEVRIDRRAPVRTNTVAVISRNYITSIATIALVTLEPPGAPLEQVPAGEAYPVISEGRSGVDEVASRVVKVGDMASLALSNVNQLLSAENRDTAMATIRSLRDLSVGLQERLAALDHTLQRLDGAAGEVGGAASRLGQAGERAGERVDLTLAEATRTLTEARRAIDQIASASVAVQQRVATATQRLETSAIRVDDQLAAAVAELRLSTEGAARVLDRLRDPRLSLLGPSKAQLGPGEQLP